MPFCPHMAFGPPENRELSIWRYCDLPRLLNTVQQRALWFARCDQLGDPWEGSISAATFKAYGDNTPRIAKAWLLKAVVNCWHMSEHESVAMWDRYGRSNMAVAIRSSIQRFVDALESSPEDVFLAAVSYIDYDKVVIPIGNAIYPMVHKRLSYSYEQELRALTMIPSPDSKMSYDLRNNPLGLYVPVDLTKLIEAIYVAPSAPSWVAETVGRAVKAALGLEIPILHSHLGEQPLF